MSSFGSMPDHRDPGSGWFGLKQSASDGPSRSVRLIATAAAALVFVLGLMLFLYLYIHYVRRRRHRHLHHHRSTTTILPSTFNLTTMTTSIAQDEAQPKTGLDPSAIAALPSFTYDKVHKPSCTECTICLSAMQEGDVVRVLPACCHVFHVGCIDMWLASSSSCPVCRAMVEPPPLPTAGWVQEKHEGEKEEASSSVSARLGASLRRMLSRERSSGRRLQGEHGGEDVERQQHPHSVN